MVKQLYGKTFSSKKEFLKWFEEHEDEIDWDYEVELAWYYKDDDLSGSLYNDLKNRYNG